MNGLLLSSAVIALVASVVARFGMSGLVKFVRTARNGRVDVEECRCPKGQHHQWPQKELFLLICVSIRVV